MEVTAGDGKHAIAIQKIVRGRLARRRVKTTRERKDLEFFAEGEGDY